MTCEEAAEKRRLRLCDWLSAAQDPVLAEYKDMQDNNGEITEVPTTLRDADLPNNELLLLEDGKVTVGWLIFGKGSVGWSLERANISAQLQASLLSNFG